MGRKPRSENITVHRGASQRDLVEAMQREFWLQWDARRDLVEPFTAAVLSQPGDAEYRRYVPVHFMRHDYYDTPISVSREEFDVIRDHLEGLGYVAPRSDEDDPDLQARNSRYFFDKETGEYTDVEPAGVFIEGQDLTVAGAPAIHASDAAAGAALQAHGASQVLGGATSAD